MKKLEPNYMNPDMALLIDKINELIDEVEANKVLAAKPVVVPAKKPVKKVVKK